MRLTPSHLKLINGTGLEVDGDATFMSGITVSGDITANGTVDGRDLAVDGAKLDAVDANAINMGKAVAMAIVFS